MFHEITFSKKNQNQNQNKPWRIEQISYNAKYNCIIEN